MQTTALYVSALIFVLVSLSHGLRFFLETEVIVAGTVISVSDSLLIGILAAMFAAWMFIAARDR